LDTYEGREDLTLELLKIYPMKTLALEERNSTESSWKAYDASSMQISLSVWKPDMSLAFADLQKNKIKLQVPKQMKMSDFQSMVESKFSMEKAVVMKRTPMM